MLLSIAAIEFAVIPVKSIVLEYVALKGEITKLYSVIDVMESIPDIQKRLLVFAIPRASPVPPVVLGKLGKVKAPDEVFVLKL